MTIKRNIAAGTHEVRDSERKHLRVFPVAKNNMSDSGSSELGVVVPTGFEPVFKP